MRDSEIYDLGNGVTAFYLEREGIRALTIQNVYTNSSMLLTNSQIDRLESILCKKDK